MSKGSAPQPVDPYASAAAQTQGAENVAQYNTQLNRYDQSNPYSSTTWTHTADTQQVPNMIQQGTDESGNPIMVPDPNGGTHTVQGGGPGSWSQQTTLSPEQQGLYEGSVQNQIQQQGNTNAQQAAAGHALTNVQNTVGSPLDTSQFGVQKNIDTSGVPQVPGQGSLTDYANQQRDSAYKNQTQYLDPQFGQQQEQLDAQLRNAGSHPGDPAYDNAMKLFTNQKQQAYESAFNNANAQGLQAEQQLFGQGLQANQQAFGQAASQGQFANQAAQQGMNQYLTARETPINEWAALAGSGGASGSGGAGTGSNLASLMPSYGSSQAGQAGAPNLQDAFNQQYQGQLNQYNANVSQGNAEMGAAASIISAIAMY